jgi:hypothetical protein
MGSAVTAPILLDGGFDGGNPQAPAAIQQLAVDRFRVFPFSEDGDANYKFALHVRATNTTGVPAPLTLEIDWADEVYMENRGFAHVGHAGAWEFVPAEVVGPVSIVRREIPPGVSAIGLCPGYGLEDHRAFVGALPAARFERRVIGRSAAGRAIEAWQIGGGTRTVLVAARCHPYETAASYCCEGLLTWLSVPGAARDALLREFRVVVLPMPNPDGVALGLCKHTGPDGVDLSRAAVLSQDGAALALRGLLDELQPAGFLDLHGWMHRHEDGLHPFDPHVRQRFVAGLADHPLFRANVWKEMTGMPDEGCPRLYCSRTFGATALEVSYRWPGRTTRQMRALGAPTLQAFCAAL